MNISTADRKSALHNQANQELESLVSRGLRAVGNGFSPVLLVKGDLNAAEIAGGELLAGTGAGNALRSALSAVLRPRISAVWPPCMVRAQTRLPAPGQPAFG